MRADAGSGLVADKFPDPLLPDSLAWRGWLQGRLQPWEGWAASDFLDAWVALEWDWFGVPRLAQLRRSAWRAPVVRHFGVRWEEGREIREAVGLTTRADVALWETLADLWALHLGIHPQVEASAALASDPARRGLELVIRPTWATLAPWQESVRVAGTLLQSVLQDVPRRPSQAVLRVVHGRLLAIGRVWDATWGHGWVTEDGSVRWIGERALAGGTGSAPAGTEFRPFDLDAVLQHGDRPDPLGLGAPVAWVHGATHHIPEEWDTLAHWIHAGRADRLTPQATAAELVLGLRRWRPSESASTDGARLAAGDGVAL